MIKITSKDNPRLKELGRLCASARFRRRSNMYVLEGVRLVCDALENGIKIRSLFVTQDGIDRLGSAYPTLCASSGEVFLLADNLAGYAGDTATPQGVFAVCEGSLTDEGLPQSTQNGVLMLCSLQDPGNVGTILRSAAAFGLSGVVLTRDCPDPASPKVLRSAMGVRRAWVTDNIADSIAALRARGVAVYAAALGRASRPVDTVSLAGAAVVIGNEGNGLPQDIIDCCTDRIILPLAPGCESLNAAMAATVFAWELSRTGRGNKS